MHSILRHYNGVPERLHSHVGSTQTPALGGEECEGSEIVLNLVELRTITKMHDIRHIDPSSVNLTVREGTVVYSITPAAAPPREPNHYLLSFAGRPET